MSKHSRETTEAGTALVDEFLTTWAARLPTAAAGEGGEGGEVTKEDELRVLKEVSAEFKDRIEGNAWTKEVLETF